MGKIPSEMIMTQKPRMIMVCGSNGAGKSTFTRAAQERGEYTMPFLDPDEIGKNAQASAIQAGKLVIAATKGHINDKVSFVRESTLSGKFDLKILQEANAKGFETELVYVCNGAPDTAVARVAQRYAKGGHTVPENDIRRRFTRSLRHLPEAIRLVDKATIYDNSSDMYRKVATFEKGQLKTHNFTPEWFKEPLEALKQRE
jgi:predicted ABC-type ATPase